MRGYAIFDIDPKRAQEKEEEKTDFFFFQEKKKGRKSSRELVYPPNFLSAKFPAARQAGKQGRGGGGGRKGKRAPRRTGKQIMPIFPSCLCRGLQKVEGKRKEEKGVNLILMWMVAPRFIIPPYRGKKEKKKERKEEARGRHGPFTPSPFS